MKEKTPQEAYLQLAALCAQGEHCEYELREKMRRWQVEAESQDRIIARLTAERYIDEERFARAFVKDKLVYNKWGRRKIQQALWQKHISDETQQLVLDEISEQAYLDVLRPLLRQKRKSTRAASDYELNQKLCRFAIGRGFTFDVIRQCLDVDEEPEYVDETED